MLGSDVERPAIDLSRFIAHNYTSYQDSSGFGEMCRDLSELSDIFHWIWDFNKFGSSPEDCEGVPK